MTHSVSTSKEIVHRSHVSCPTRSPCLLSSNHFFFVSTFPTYCILLTVMNNHTIHGQKDGLVDWPYRVLFQVMSPTPLMRSSARRLHQFSFNEGEQVSVPCAIPLRTSKLRLYLRRSPMFMQRREVQHCKNLSLQWRTFHVKLISFSKRM